MSETVIVSLIAFVGTLAGSLFGVLASNKLTNFRLESLEAKVKAHNNLVERMYSVEARAKSNSHRIDELEEKI